jgi:hypothetical protein
MQFQVGGDVAGKEFAYDQKYPLAAQGAETDGVEFRLQVGEITTERRIHWDHDGD